MILHSCQGMPMSAQAGLGLLRLRGEDVVEGVGERGCGREAQAKLEMLSMMALKRPTSALRRARSMIATLKASWPPSMVPRAMAPMKFSLACSSDGGMRTVPAVAGTSVSGTSILATRMVPGRS